MMDGHSNDVLHSPSSCLKRNGVKNSIIIEQITEPATPKKSLDDTPTMEKIDDNPAEKSSSQKEDLKSNKTHSSSSKVFGNKYNTGSSSNDKKPSSKQAGLAKFGSLSQEQAIESHTFLSIKNSNADDDRSLLTGKDGNWEEAPSTSKEDETDDGDLEAGSNCASTRASQSQGSSLRGGLKSKVSQLSEYSERVTEKGLKKLFGENYCRRESTYIIFAGALIALNCGMINGSTLSGLVTRNGAKASIAGFTSTYTKSAMAMADSDWDAYDFNSCLILSYSLGAFICGWITPNATPYQIEPSYGPTLFIGGCFLMMAALLAALEFEPRYIFFCASAATGIQNGLASLYSSNLIRCCLTGITSDVFLVMAQVIRGGSRKQLAQASVSALIILFFWLGGLASFYLTGRFLHYTLFFNAVLYWAIGLSLAVFLVKELDVTVEAAILGTWNNSSRHFNNENIMTDEDWLYLFDEIDDDQNGEIRPDELLDALLANDAKVNARQIKILIKTVDVDDDGFIGREEWATLFQKMYID